MITWVTIRLTGLASSHRMGDPPVGLPEPAASTELHPALAVLPGHLLWRAHARVTVALGEVLPPGVDIHAYAVLMALPAGVTRSQQELADAVSTSRTTLARVAADLTAAGLVERVRNPHDRRSYALTRTSAGAEAAGTWQHHADDLQASLTAGLDARERAELHDLLTRIAGDDVSPETPAELRASLGFLVSRIHARMHREFLAALEPIRLEPRLFGALTALDATGPIAQAELARLLGVSGPSVVQVADALEARGLVVRRRDPADRRTQLLHLLPEAPAVRAEAARIAAETLGHHLGPIDAAGTARLVTLLQRFVTSG